MMKTLFSEPEFDWIDFQYLPDVIAYSPEAFKNEENETDDQGGEL